MNAFQVSLRISYDGLAIILLILLYIQLSMLFCNILSTFFCYYPSNYELYLLLFSLFFSPLYIFCIIMSSLFSNTISLLYSILIYYRQIFFTTVVVTLDKIEIEIHLPRYFSV